MAPVSKAFDIVPTNLAIEAMRDSGYKNAAYAIAELVDNSIQAGASCVDVLCKEKEVVLTAQTRRRVDEIAVFDNGNGMDKETLRKALQFGNGERLNDRQGIGRFGMGLPNSSISQARRVDVWTWQNGHATAIHSYLDLVEISRGEINEVPEPTSKTIPPEWLEFSSNGMGSKSGTLVVWSNLDKCSWKTAQAIFRNSEFTIGRVYRRFIQNNKVKIRMAAFLNTANSLHIDDNVSPNDPLYLTTGTTCPDPYYMDPMFEPYGEPHKIDLRFDGIQSSITINFAVAKREARVGYNPGSTEAGRHAGNNLGVSIMRADRELEMQSSWCISYDPRERWWGVEIDFPPLLDEIFGVPNTKQGARALNEFASLTMEQIVQREGYSTEHELYSAWVEEGDSRWVLLDVKRKVESNLAAIRKTIKAQTARDHSNTRYGDPDSAEMRGTKATKDRIKQGYRGTSDADETMDSEERKTIISEHLAQQGLEQGEAEKRAELLVTDGRKYEFYEVDLNTAEFFTVRAKAGSILIGLNTTHPAYEHFISLTRPSREDGDLESLKIQLKNTYQGLRLLFEAWARYEDEIVDNRKKELAQEARMDWGRVARDFFRDE